VIITAGLPVPQLCCSQPWTGFSARTGGNGPKSGPFRLPASRSPGSAVLNDDLEAGVSRKAQKGRRSVLADDFWQYALLAAVLYIRAGASRAATRLGHLHQDHSTARPRRRQRSALGHQSPVPVAAALSPGRRTGSGGMPGPVQGAKRPAPPPGSARPGRPASPRLSAPRRTRQAGQPAPPRR
jgi:hypothetical protein